MKYTYDESLAKDLEQISSTHSEKKMNGPT